MSEVGPDYDDQPDEEIPVELDPVMLATEVARVTGSLRSLFERVGKHDELLEDIIALLEDTPGGPWDWSRLEPAAARELWLMLGEWVQWLERRYLVNISGDEYDLVACWWQHPIAVELLTALMVSHRSAYSTRKRVPSMELVDWHTRAFVPTFALLNTLKVFKNCRTGHSDAPPSPARHDPQAFAQFVDQVAPELPIGADPAVGDGEA
jgi:hypothetical protein